MNARIVSNFFHAVIGASLNLLHSTTDSKVQAEHPQPNMRGGENSAIFTLYLRNGTR